MTTFRYIPTLAAILALSGAALGQSTLDQSAAAPQQQVAPDSLPTLSAEQLDQLLGPIALYPDPLIAQILPAATYPIDIVRAARFVRSGGGADQIDQQDWDPSVRAVAHYPSIIQMMDESIAWTQQLGQAFIAQQDDVMQSVQRLRAQAQNVGNLTSNVQQQVLVEDQAIRILPANPDVIYVPTYQPSVVYYQPAPLYTSYISYGYGYPLGIWLDLDCDWNRHWFYRPGWSWNRWHDHYFIDNNRFLRPRFDRGYRPGVPPPGLWHRDDHRPFTFPGRRLTRPSDFDRFRGRDNRLDHRPTQNQIPRPGTIDRGWPSGPRQTPGDNTRRDLQRPISGGNTFQRPQNQPTLAPGLVPQTRNPGANTNQPRRDFRPAQSPSGMPAIPAATPRAAPAPRTLTPQPARTIAPQPARVNPPPVRVAPPPAAAQRRSAPAYVQPPQRDNIQRNLDRGHR